VLLEANTYRYRGHSMSDPATYRTKTEVEQERKGDPIPKLRQFAVEQMKIPESEFEAIDAEVKATVDAAVKFADQSPEPSLDELHEDIFVEPGEADVRPRERVHGVKVEWPKHPGPQDYRVTWDLEPREQAEEAEQKAGLKQPARA
jgi:pyruvate dehydrogenase E1 component alpha subunit